MSTRKATTFEVKISPQRANSGTIETCLKASLKKLIDYDANVMVDQLNDTTLRVSIVESILAGKL